MDFQLTNMSSSVQRASSPKSTVTYMTIEKNVQLRRSNSDSLLYNESFHFKLFGALLMRQQGSGATS